MTDRPTAVCPECVGAEDLSRRGFVRKVTGAVVATSANLPGGPDPHSLADVPAQIRQNVVAAIDGGTLPGTPSTVVDLTGDEPRLLRTGAVSADEVRRRLGAPVRSD